MKTPKRSFHIVTMISAPCAAVMKEQRKEEREYRRLKKLQQRDPHEGTPAIEAMNEKRRDQREERMAALVGGRKLAGVFSTRLAAQKFVKTAAHGLSEAGYFTYLVIESVKEGPAEASVFSLDPEWQVLAGGNYKPCRQPDWASPFLGFCM